MNIIADKFHEECEENETINCVTNRIEDERHNSL